MEFPKELAGGRPTYLGEGGFRCWYENDRWCMAHVPVRQAAKEVSLKTKVYSPHLCFWQNEDVEVLAEKPVQAEQKDPSPASDEPWVDPDFPPCAASVGDYALKKLGGEVRGWAKDGINKDLSKEFCDGSQGTRVELGEVEDVLHSLAAFFPSRPRSTVLSFKIFRSQPW